MHLAAIKLRRARPESLESLVGPQTHGALREVLRNLEEQVPIDLEALAVVVACARPRSNEVSAG